MVYCDFEDVRRYRDAVPKARDCRHADRPGDAADHQAGRGRIAADDRQGCTRRGAGAQSRGADAFSRGTAAYASCIGDFSLNIANELTADLFAAEGLSRLTPSYDLNWEQLAAMLRPHRSGLFEIVVHQHMPMFHMEHCVFAAMLSNGKDCHRLRPAVRSASRRAARPRRRGISAAGRHRLPQHGVQLRGPIGGRVYSENARASACGISASSCCAKREAKSIPLLEHYAR